MVERLPWRKPDGSIIWCDVEQEFPDRTHRSVRCARVIGHDGDHENGTFRWQNVSLDTESPT